MQPYGSVISFDVGSNPVRMRVRLSHHVEIKRKFTADYGLPPVMEELDSSTSSVVFTFDPSVDAETFLRHLRTMTPEQYEDTALYRQQQ